MSAKILYVIVNFIDNSKTDFLVDGGVTYSGFVLAESLYILDQLVPSAFKTSPEIRKHMEKVYGLQKINASVATRTHSEAKRSNDILFTFCCTNKRCLLLIQGTGANNHRYEYETRLEDAVGFV